MRTPTEQLFEILREQGPAAEEMGSRALAFAARAHHGEFRNNGETYLSHAVVVALHVARAAGDLDTIVAALLHGDAAAAHAQLPAGRAAFPDAVSTLLTHVARLKQAGDEVQDADPRAVLVRVADRLHNMQTISFVDEQRDKSYHTLTRVVPQARALGLTDIATELEVLATAILQPRSGTDPRARSGRPARGITTATRILGGAARLLPASCRDRWRGEWQGELHALPSVRERLAFTASLLRGMPAMAVHTRRRHEVRGRRPR